MRLFIATVIAIAAASTALAVIGTGVAAAQTPPAEPASAAATPPAGADARARLLAADTDKDGRWSKAEWTAAGRRERGFGFLDADGDGFVSRAELQSGMAKLQARRGAN